MSGAHGWGGNDRSFYNPQNDRDDFSSARNAYQSPRRGDPPTNCPNCGSSLQGGITCSYCRTFAQGAVNNTIDNRSAPLDRMDLLMGSTMIPITPRYTDLRPKVLKSTKENVLIVMMDMTGSMGQWREDIFKFLVNLYEESQTLLGQNLEILFIAFGDVKYGDPIQVTTFGSGSELDSYLKAFVNMGGGGDGEESPELAAYYLLESVDVSSAKHVFAYIITDEAASPRIDDMNLRKSVNLSLKRELVETRHVFQALLRKMELFVILKETTVLGYSSDSILRFWNTTLGPNRVLPLDRANLVVETMLASIARRTDQDEVFNSSYQARRGSTAYGAVNYDLVQKSVAMIPNGSSVVQTPSPGTGTRNLSDFLDDVST